MGANPPTGSPQELSAEFSHLPTPETPAPLTETAPIAATPAVAELIPAGEVSAPPDVGEISPEPLHAGDPDAAGAPDDPMAQVTSVSQLSDVQPADWAFGALQNLVERYGCIAGYPDGTFRGNRAMTRYEFAAGLNACLERITQLIPQAVSTADFITQQDLATVRQLQEEFGTELAALRGRVTTLENRAATLESQRITSSTTVLGGEVIFAFADATGGGPPGNGATNTILTNLVRLQTVSTFSGKDLLRIELGAGNVADRGFANQNSLGTDMTLLSYQGDTNNQIQLDLLEYRFAAFNDRVVFTVRPVGFSLSSVLTANSPYFDTGRGAISRFAEASPLFKIGALDAGVGLDWLISDRMRLQVAYGTRDSNDPDASQERRGVFAASHSALGVQLLTRPADKIITGLAYINAYSRNGSLDTFTGSFNADTSGAMGEPVQINAVSGTLQWRAARNLTFGTWGGIIFTDSTTSDASATTTTYLFSLELSDPFGRKGDLLAFMAGQPPKLRTGNGVTEDSDTSLHLEAFYRFRVSDRITVTPGFFYIINPEHDAGNDDILVGVLRTTFRF
ncbi:iron uptake porin [Kamptonema formosum]|uniref:iron uptake porin n=1 Tax=Kamptonema formosum TaxID=331992 RepID=UPI00034AF5DC|nr:iron uptake porin [Oscillatoria sp. PCC 10802]